MIIGGFNKMFKNLCCILFIIIIFSSSGYVLGFVNIAIIDYNNSNMMGSYLTSNNTYQNISSTIYLNNLKGNDANPGSF